MTNAKKIIFTTESYETLILYMDNKRRAVAFCEQCSREVEMLMVDQAVSTSGIRTRELMSRINSKEIHALETGSGHILVCAVSLPKKTKREIKTLEGGPAVPDRKV